MATLKFITRQNHSRVIMFIHGFCGGASTWVNSKGVHFGTLLNQHASISCNFDICEYIYNTTTKQKNPLNKAIRLVQEYIFDRNPSTPITTPVGIATIAKCLTSTISAELDYYNEIVFICHSQGGLIAREYALESFKAKIDCKTNHLFSLAVPHEGSAYAAVANDLLNYEVSELAPRSDFLEKLNSEWQDNKDSLPKIYYFYGIYDKFVDEKSAAPRNLTDKSIYVDDDHRTITKPKDEDSVTIKYIEKVLSETVLQCVDSQPACQTAIKTECAKPTSPPHAEPSEGRQGKKKEIISAFLKRLSHTLEKNNNSPCSLVIFDVDGLRSINSKYGPDVGDAITDTLDGMLSWFDFLCCGRCGTDEFYIVLPNHSLKEATLIADQLRKSINSYDWNTITNGLYVTCSFGVALRKQNEPAESLSIRAMDGVKKSKRSNKKKISEGQLIISSNESPWYIDHTS